MTNFNKHRTKEDLHNALRDPKDAKISGTDFKYLLTKSKDKMNDELNK